MEISTAQQWYQWLADVHRILASNFQVEQQSFVKAQFFYYYVTFKKAIRKIFEIISEAGVMLKNTFFVKVHTLIGFLSM